MHQLTVSTLQCFSALSAADDDEDERIEAKEYVTFVNGLSHDKYKNFTYSQLPEIIKNTFNTLSADNVIYVSNSTPGSSPSMEQLEFLRQVCDDTGAAIALALVPSASPTSFETTESPTSSPTLSSSPTHNLTQSPTTVTQTLSFVQTSLPTSLPIVIPSIVPTSQPSLSSSSFSLLLEIPVAFTISNKYSSNIPLSDRNTLMKSFNQMCSQIVKKKDSGPVFVNGSAFIDEIQEANCPELASSGTFCHNIYFEFKVNAEKSNDPEEIRQEFSDAAQMAIAVGKLDTKNLSIQIEFGFIPFRSTRSDKKDDKEANVALIAGAATHVLLFITLLLVIWYLVKRRDDRKKDEMPLDNSSLFSLRSKSEKFEDEYDKTSIKLRPDRLLALDSISEQLYDEESIDPSDLSDSFVVITKDREEGSMEQALQMSSLNESGLDSNSFMEMTEQNVSSTVAESLPLHEQHFQLVASTKTDS